MFMVGVVALASVLIGLARLGAWVIDRREQRAAAAIRDAAQVAQARAQFLPTPSHLRHLEIDAEPLAATFEWTALNEEAYQRFRGREQAALKRGDLIVAAEYAELADRVGYVAGQGNEP